MQTCVPPEDCFGQSVHGLSPGPQNFIDCRTVHDMMTCLEHRKTIVLDVRYESAMAEHMTEGKATW